MDVLLAAILLQVITGIAAFVCSKSPRTVTIVGASGTALACLVGMFPTLRVLLGGVPESLRLNWDASHGAFCVGLDMLGAFFLLPVLGLSGLAAAYGSEYMLSHRHQKKSLGASWLFYSAFVAGMQMVVIARTALLFLFTWEVMSISAYFLVTFEHERTEVRRAGWVYLIATHLGVAFLLLAFLLLAHQAGGLEFEAFRQMPAFGAGWASVVFVLGLIGFGAKTGLVPFHVWLPEAHPAAPSHISALMSGVMVKMGVYGMLRLLTFLGQPAPWWGLTLAAFGLLTGLVGVFLALYQRDVKRTLAYSTIENMGLICLALGTGVWAWASDLPAIAVLAIAAALLHVWNHALMKSLLFFGAGSVLHATGTKDIEKLGGIAQRMPRTAFGMIVGCVAIAALPPLNGFVSKWLIYLSLVRTALSTSGVGSLVALLAVGLVALIGGLTVMAFVRVCGIALLGSPRSETAEYAKESSQWLWGPMGILVVLCLIVAVIPQTIVALVMPIVGQLVGEQVVRSWLNVESTYAPLQILGCLNAWTASAILAALVLLLARSRSVARAETRTWGCGYIRPTSRMQYTGQSFAEMATNRLLPRFLRPRTRKTIPQGLFPGPSEFNSKCPDPVSENVYEPLFRDLADRFSRLRILQQGKAHIYLLYIALAVVMALVWVSLRRWWDIS
jgi:formate hydrogenlyase subunit 3/multisubunit Na+/H+ antiporter MnhD subunit